MAGLKDIRRRIASVKNTKKITYAMKLVSAAKLKRSQEAVVRSREYTQSLSRIISQLESAGVLATTTHPLMEKREVKTTRIIVVGANRGLSGGYNSNLNKKLQQTIKENSNSKVEIVILGRKPAEYLRRIKQTYLHAYEELSDDPGTWPVADVLSDAVKDYTAGRVDRVLVLFTKFKSAISMTPTVEQVLPVASIESASGAKSGVKNTESAIMEPTASAVFEALIPRIVRSQVQQAAFDAKTSEHGARMTAMDSATKNAGDLIKSLTLTANKLRQSGITAELLDIIGGAEAIS